MIIQGMDALVERESLGREIIQFDAFSTLPEG